jgi:hypothetical protein
VKDAAARLRHVRWRYLDVAVRAPVPADWHWIYVPEPRLPFFRVGIYTNAAASMAPAGCGGLYVELNERTGPIDLAAVAAGLVEVGALARAEDIAFVEEHAVEYAYVVFDAAWSAARGAILGWLERHGVRSCGRYGGWVYNGMEDCLLAGREAASWASEHVVKNRSEGA